MPTEGTKVAHSCIRNFRTRRGHSPSESYQTVNAWESNVRLWHFFTNVRVGSADFGSWAGQLRSIALTLRSY
jgi:hypothetical protein